MSPYIFEPECPSFKMGIQEFARPYKSRHLIGHSSYPSATLVFITSTLGGCHLQILHVLEPALQLAQLPYRLQTFYCWVSRSILICSYILSHQLFNGTDTIHLHFRV